jgi:hypothetical protein
MPDPKTIIDQLTVASISAAGVAIAWHVAIVVAVVALMLGWRPSNRAAGVMLAGPIASAAAVMLAFGNPFNGAILGALSLALVLLALRLGPGQGVRTFAAAKPAGILMIVFGALYPHFLQRGTPLAYLYAAPTGLIPCPTLSLVIGFALLAGGLGSRAWSLVLASVGVFYGLFGVARLRVYLDVPLILGAAALLTLATRQRRSPRAPAGAVRWIEHRANVGMPEVHR